MYSIFLKEISSFFSSVIGYLVIAVFLTLIGLFMWVFPDTSVLDYNFATLDQLFVMAPLIFLFLIPAITMRSFAEESQSGTIEFLATKPISDTEIVGGKFLANFVLVLFALIPTLLYYYSVYLLGSPVGNLDSGAILGSYIGLFFLCGAFVAIGMLASVLTKNQIVAFILGSFLCFVFHWAFTFLASLPIFHGSLEQIVQKLGINYHYSSVSKGALHTKDLVYFISIIFLFLSLCKLIFSNRK
jgi:ABC-2 type transport system permease protein